MKIKNLTKCLIAGLSACLFLTSCSKTKTGSEVNSQSKVSASANTNANLNTGAKPITDDGTKETVLTMPSSANSTVVRDPSKPLKAKGEDNSEILSTYDGAGTLSEERYFQDSNKIHAVVVITQKDGTKTGRVYARDGGVKDLPSNMISTALTSTDDDLAFKLGFKEFKKPEPVITTAQQIPQTQTAPMPQVPQMKPAAPETATVAQSPTEEQTVADAKPQTSYPQTAKSDVKSVEKKP
jgi:hypothetical protein